jgi:hypothetical protein
MQLTRLNKDVTVAQIAWHLLHDCKNVGTGAGLTSWHRCQVAVFQWLTIGFEFRLLSVYLVADSYLL